MTKQIKVDTAEEDEENFDFTSFDPAEMLTNKSNQIISSKFNYMEPPDEDFLTNNTLWPESNKLFGHGYEVIALATSHDGKFIASGGKSQSEKHSKLFVWNANKNQPVAKLEGHNLTIVQIEFSPSDKYLLSVSRDRSWCLYRKKENIEGEIESPYSFVQIGKETHGRIIWGCSWAHDEKLFITGSRDKTIKFWSENKENLFEEIASKEYDDAVTSVNVAPIKIKDYYILFIGFELGSILIESFNSEDKKLKTIYEVPQLYSHGATVRRIKSVYLNEMTIMRIATCSDDHSVRIFEIDYEFLNSKL